MSFKMNNTNEEIKFRTINNNDLPFLYNVYRSTRLDEMALSGWPIEEINHFLKMQFDLQHTQYMANYVNANFDIIFLNNTPIGRLYIDHRNDEIRIIDIALLPEYRTKGIGSSIIGDIIHMSEDTNKSITLHVEHNNPALNFYKKRNFIIENAESIYIFMKRMPHNDNK